MYVCAKSPNTLGDEKSLKDHVQKIFDENEKVYGTRKLKVELEKSGEIVSRRRIGRLMRELGLVSVYTIAQFRVHKATCNEDPVSNLLNREFRSTAPRTTIVSDLTYVRVGTQWNYICLLTDLFNREIIGYSCGRYKDADLVLRAFSKVKGSLEDVQLFHTDRGSEFKNEKINEVLKVFHIQRSLSMKGCPYDNAVAEATVKLIKMEFVYPRRFATLDQLETELERFLSWFNTKRIHSTLGYLSPVEYKTIALNNFV